MKTLSILKSVVAGLALLLLAAPGEASARPSVPANSGFRINAVAPNEFLVYPNPTNGAFMLEMPANVSVEVADAGGKILAKADGEQKASFRLNNVARAVYHVKVSAQNSGVSTITMQ